jgi:hypothetical protein
MFKAYALFRETDGSVRKVLGFSKAVQAKMFCMEKDNVFLSVDDLIERLSESDMNQIFQKYSTPEKLNEIKSWLPVYTSDKQTFGYLWTFMRTHVEPSYWDKPGSKVERISRKKKDDRLYVYQKIENFDKAILKLPTQAQCLARILKDEQRSKWTEPELKAVVTKASYSKALKTRQDPWRIFQYYRNDLMDLGLVRLTRRSLKDL